jgi:hypothetical protein
LSPNAGTGDAGTGDTDKFGTVWTKGVHADNKSKKSDGSWKARRGAAKKAPPPSAEIAGAEIAAFDAMQIKLVTLGVDPQLIIEQVSKAVSGDLSKTTGGYEAMVAAADPKITGKAMSCLHAIAANAGHAL